MQPVRHLPLACLCVFLLPPASRAAVNGTDTAVVRAAVDRAIRPLMARYDLPGMAVAVTVDGQTMFFNYGLASKEQHIAVSENTLFELGSVSKTFTATLGCHAWDLGKLSFDDHPGKTMPALKGSAIDRASLLELGTYTAGGLPLQMPDEVTDETQMLAYFRGWTPDAPPGTQRRYSNPSIGLFGHAAALALRSNFADAVEGQLFPALGLTHSHIRIPAAAMADYAWGYDSKNRPVRVSPGVFDAEAYGVKSSAADMIRFVRQNIDPGQLPEPMRRAVDCTHTGYFQVGDTVQGLGWEQYRLPVSLADLQAGNGDKMSREANPATRLRPPQAPARGTLFNKTGATRGFGAYVLFVPEYRVGIVMLANKNYPNAARVEAAHAILEQLIK
ncbi:class C beta-lactamase [Massilia sp. LXY-6]|uniref:class C beta-lactamase n=1 Tax=Massilia sp. LXY-6 TaxID=3379823 RepID=UPI003EDF04A0